MTIFAITLAHGDQALGSPKVLVSKSPLSSKIEQPTITALRRDNQGILWIGTQHGLYRFDGIHFSRFGSDLQGESYIPNSHIGAIIEDTNRRIVIATVGGGVFISDLEKKRFTPILATTANEVLYPRYLSFASDRKLWVGGKEGLFRYEAGDLQASNGSLSQFHGIHETTEVSAMASNRNGDIYVAFGLKLYQVSGEDESVSMVDWTRETQNKLDTITAVTFDNSDNLYIGTDSGTITSLSRLGDQYRPIFSSEKGVGNSIISMTFHNDFLWIATYNGLFFTDPSFSFIESKRQDNSALFSNHLTALFGDGSLLWIGTYQGLNTVSIVPFETFSEISSGVFNDVLTFEEDMDRNLWVGTFNGVYLYDATSETHTPIHELPNASELLDHRVTTMAHRDRKLWIGFLKNGVQILDTDTMNVTIPAISKIEDMQVTKIMHRGEDSTWIATYNTGLHRIDGGSHTSYLAKGLPEESVTVLLQTSEGKFIASSEHTVYEYDDKLDSFLPINFRYGSDPSPPFILSISESSDGSIWIGTKDQGLFIWSREAQAEGDLVLENSLGPKDGNFTTIYAIQFDEDGYGWCSTQSGVMKIGSKGEVLARFSVYDGLQGADFNFGSSFRDSIGRIYFGGSNGYNRFFPQNIKASRDVPKLYMANISISRDGVPETFDASSFGKIQLTHKDQFIQFEFGVLDFIDPEKNQYRYILEGFDHDWIDNGTRNSARYTSLPAGEYTMRVQGANSAGVWNRDGISIGVQVLPAPWLTWWAFTVYALAGFLLLWLLLRAYISFAVQRKFEQKTLEMDEAEERADDEMQEQLDIHDDLVKSVYRHSISTLNLVGELLSTKGSHSDDDSACELLQSSVSRLMLSRYWRNAFITRMKYFWPTSTSTPIFCSPSCSRMQLWAAST